MGMRFWVFYLACLACLALQSSSSAGDNGTFDIVAVNESANRPILTGLGKHDVGNRKVDEKKHLKAGGTVVVDKKKLYELEVKPKQIVIQGLVYCRSGSNLISVEGAVAKVTCLAVKENGYESSPYSTMTSPTDKKGYFYTILPEPKHGFKYLIQCKVTLGVSPLKTCSVPTKTGAFLGPYHILPNKHYLFSVGPFIYSPTPKPNNSKY